MKAKDLFLTLKTPPPEDEIMRNWSSGGPVVSILCPTYNHEDLIENAIKSFLNQRTNFPFEIIIRDDHSSDGTAEIVISYSRKYPNLIKPIIELIRGYPHIRSSSKTYPLAEGSYIALCDGDDFWTDLYKLQKHFNFHESNSKIILTYNAAHNYRNNKFDSLHRPGSKYYYSGEELLNYVQILPSTMFFKKVPLTWPVYYNYIPNGDNWLISNLGLHGGAYYLDNIKPTIRNLHPGSITAQYGDPENLSLAQLQTRYWISVYWNKTGKKDIARLWRKQFIDDIYYTLFVFIMQKKGSRRIKLLITYILKLSIWLLQNIYRRILLK